MFFSSLSCLIILRNSLTPSGSIPRVGSSRIITSGSFIKISASPRRCFIPREYLPVFYWLHSLIQPSLIIQVPVAQLFFVQSYLTRRYKLVFQGLSCFRKNLNHLVNIQHVFLRLLYS